MAKVTIDISNLNKNAIDALLKAGVKIEGLYFSDSHQKYIPVAEMDTTHLKNAALKLYREEAMGFLAKLARSKADALGIAEMIIQGMDYSNELSMLLKEMENR